MAKKKVNFGDKKVHAQGDAMTPADLLRAVFHDDDKALLHSFGKSSRAAKKAFLEDKKKGIIKTRKFSRSANGKVQMAEKITNKPVKVKTAKDKEK